MTPSTTATMTPRTMTPMTMAAMLLATLAAGCGGASKPADTTPSGGGAERAEPGGGDGMVPPEKIDEITHSLERKRPIISRCLAIAVDNKELPKNSSGKVTLEIVISPSGRAESVKIVKATLESKMLDECIINHVKEIVFPELPKAFETSFVYGFEAM